jgi:hypothetical protein
MYVYNVYNKQVKCIVVYLYMMEELNNKKGFSTSGGTLISDPCERNNRYW